MDALDSYSGTKIAHGGFPTFGEKNKGKPKLDPQEEYVFELVERDARPGKGFQSKEDKAAGKEAPKVVKVYLTWKEANSGVQVLQSYRIDQLFWGNPDGSMRSGVLQFLEDIGMPVQQDVIPVWGATFVLTMKIRARVVPRIRNGEAVQDEYVFKEGSYRKYRS